ncbi:MAG: hypothetical protein IPL48_05725 [Bacteroidetes bacterium]|nr:hypothetical protein [Bacteroidota bacterium]
MKKIFLAVLIFQIGIAQAQNKKPYFNTITVQDGLPEAYIQSYLEDNKGYLWLGTQNGLVRYDGYYLKPYPMLSEKGIQIPTNSIKHLLQDRNGKIWAFTGQNGIYYYDSNTDKFEGISIDQKLADTLKSSSVIAWEADNQNNIYWLLINKYNTNKMHLYRFNSLEANLEEYGSEEKEKNYLALNNNGNIVKDNAGIIWIYNDSLVSYFDTTSHSFKPYFDLSQYLKNHMFVGITKDPITPDILWLNTYASNNTNHINPTLVGRDIIQLNTKTKAYIVFSPDSNDQNALAFNCINILTDSLKRLWFATEHGISLFNHNNSTFTNYVIPFEKGTINTTYIRTLVADNVGNLWLGGTFSGICYLDTKTALATIYPSDNEEGNLPKFQFINTLFYDRYGTLWVNTPWSGISYINNQKTLFATQSINPNEISAIKESNTSNFRIVGSHADSIGFIADNISLFAWHPETNKFSNIDINQKEVYKNITQVIVGIDGNIWISTWSAGLFRYNPKTKLVTQFKNDPNDSTSILSNTIRKIISDKNGNIWIGTYSNGLCSFNIQTQKFTRYPYIINDGEMKPNNKLDDDQISSMLFDDEGILWIGTNNGGLNRFDIKTNQFKSYLDNDQGFYCVISLLEDSKKRLWVGTYLSGLFLFDKNTGTLTKYSEQDGLLHNTVQYLKEDNAGNIWCGSERGFSRLNPEDKSIVVFDNLSKHLAGARQNLIYVDSIGTFYINLSKGIMSFNPADIKANMVPPSVVIESVRYQPDGADFGKDTIVYTEVNQKIVLRYNENRINFQYVALHFVDAENNQYAYQLVGYDKDWIQAGTQRNATYTNLSPGTYTFKVKAANSDGVWNNTGTSITIKILPPWWKTWWAYVLYILIISASIRGYIHYRSKALRKKNLVLEEKVTHRTKQLQESIENLKTTQSQLVQSEKMASLGELTAGIAHEIQNPLNFVNNFSEVNTELIDELKTELAIGNKQLAIELADDIKANEQKINHHGKRADAIVKGMLQHSRSSTGRKELSDINALCDEYLRLSYHGLRAKDKTFNATMKTDFDNSIGEINIISQDIGRVILNLLTNAFYAVSEKKKQLGDGYEPTVSINTREVNKHIEIHVSDNGNGIPQNILDKIFQPFFTTKPTGQGTGLGLSLSYDIITKGHGGELKVETKEGEGSVFIILLPVV